MYSIQSGSSSSSIQSPAAVILFPCCHKVSEKVAIEQFQGMSKVTNWVVKKVRCPVLGCNKIVQSYHRDEPIKAVAKQAIVKKGEKRIREEETESLTHKKPMVKKQIPSSSSSSSSASEESDSEDNASLKAKYYNDELIGQYMFVDDEGRLLDGTFDESGFLKGRITYNYSSTFSEVTKIVEKLLNLCAKSEDDCDCQDEMFTSFIGKRITYECEEVGTFIRDELDGEGTRTYFSGRIECIVMGTLSKGKIEKGLFKAGKLIKAEE